MVEAETNDHNRHGKRLALNRIPESLQRKTVRVSKVMIVDHCHENLVQVQSLVNRTVDLLAMSVGRPVDSQIAGAAFPVDISEATVVRVPASQAPAAHGEPVRHTKSDPTYLPFIDNSERQFPSTGTFPSGSGLTHGVYPLSWAAPWLSRAESKRFLLTSS